VDYIERVTGMATDELVARPMCRTTVTVVIELQQNNF